MSSACDAATAARSSLALAAFSSAVSLSIAASYGSRHAVARGSKRLKPHSSAAGAAAAAALAAASGPPCTSASRVARSALAWLG